MINGKEHGLIGLEGLLELFEDSLTVAEINAAGILGDISATIAKKRIDLGMTQKEFAHYLDVTQGMISKWEGGDYNFSIRTLCGVAEKLDLHMQVSMRNEYEANIEIRKKDSMFLINEKADEEYKTRSTVRVIDFTKRKNHYSGFHYRHTNKNGIVHNRWKSVEVEEM